MVLSLYLPQAIKSLFPFHWTHIKCSCFFSKDQFITVCKKNHLYRRKCSLMPPPLLLSQHPCGTRGHEARPPVAGLGHLPALALPTKESIGIYDLQVVATDSGRGITQDAGGGHAAASPLPCLPPRARHGGAQQLAARHGLEAQRAPDPRQLLQATSTRAASPSSSWPRRAPARSGSAGTTTRCRGSPAPRRTSSRSTTP